MHSGTQSFRQPRYFGSFLVPSALSLLVGRIGSLRPLVQILALPSSAARADGANRDAAAHAATAGTSCRLLHLELEEGAGCDIVGAACAAACGCTSVGESRDGAKISASKQVAAMSRSDARTWIVVGAISNLAARRSVDFPPFVQCESLCRDRARMHARKSVLHLMWEPWNRSRGASFKINLSF